jgi:Mrp family chromosome partitioning ATPase
LVQATGIPNLFLLSSGPLRGRTPVSSLFHSERMMQLMEYFKDSYDIVLIDTPPLTISDARILGPLADGVVLVLRAGAARMDSVQAAEEGLTQDGCRLVGTVLNDWNPRSNGYGVYSDRYHKNAYYKTTIHS